MISVRRASERTARLVIELQFRLGELALATERTLPCSRLSKARVTFDRSGQQALWLRDRPFQRAGSVPASGPRVQREAKELW
jgi:hypothetical protein